jgi:hypothetical protein
VLHIAHLVLELYVKCVGYFLCETPSIQSKFDRSVERCKCAVCCHRLRDDIFGGEVLTRRSVGHFKSLASSYQRSFAAVGHNRDSETSHALIGRSRRMRHCHLCPSNSARPRKAQNHCILGNHANYRGERDARFVPVFSPFVRCRCCIYAIIIARGHPPHAHTIGAHIAQIPSQILLRTTRP